MASGRRKGILHFWFWSFTLRSTWGGTSWESTARHRAGTPDEKVDATPRTYTTRVCIAGAGRHRFERGTKRRPTRAPGKPTAVEVLQHPPDAPLLSHVNRTRRKAGSRARSTGNSRAGPPHACGGPNKANETTRATELNKERKEEERAAWSSCSLAQRRHSLVCWTPNCTGCRREDNSKERATQNKSPHEARNASHLTRV